MSLAMREQLRNLDRRMADFNPIAMKFQATIAADKLKADALAAIVDRAFIGEDALPRNEKAFEEQRKRAKARLPAVTDGLVRSRPAIREASQEYGAAIAKHASLGRVLQDVKAARERLIYPGFLTRTPWERLEHLPRYLRGYALRLQKYRANAERDQKHAAGVHTLWQNYEARVKSDHDAGRRDPRLEEFRWQIGRAHV